MTTPQQDYYVHNHSKLNKIPTNSLLKIIYKTIAETTDLNCPSEISKVIFVYVDSYLQTQNVC